MTYIDLLNVGSKQNTAKQTSTSSVDNSRAGFCPKCKKTMSTASISSGEDVYYCESCRVALPVPNK